MKKIILIALTALALGLASIGVAAPTIAGSKPGVISSSNSAEVGGPAIAGSNTVRGGQEGN